MATFEVVRDDSQRYKVLRDGTTERVFVDETAAHNYMRRCKDNDHIRALRAENARLREALAALVAACHGQRSMCAEWVDALAAADAALADAEGTTRRSTTPP